MSNPSPARLADAGRTAIRERPLLMSGPMVRAILDGQKSQTRRVPDAKVSQERPAGFASALLRLREDFDAEWYWPDHPDFKPIRVRNRFGKPGDRLWVRETFWDYDAGDAPPTSPKAREERIEYRATPWDHEFADPEECGDWKPSIHMPRWASRITLEITAVRVERLQDISREDCNAEGLRHASPEFRTEMCVWRDSATVLAELPRRFFGKLWDSINADRGYSWDANPWVWVIEFRRLSSTEPAHA